MGSQAQASDLAAEDDALGSEQAAIGGQSEPPVEPGSGGDGSRKGGDSTAERDGVSREGSGNSSDASGSEDEVAPAAAYGDQLYWNQRYAEEVREGNFYDWYFGYETPALRDLLRRLIPRCSSVLQVGVGTSTLQTEMVADGYRNIVSTDCSATVVEHMAGVHAEVAELSYLVADCRSMPQFDDRRFDAVLDKGTLDALMCSDTWDPDARAMLSEVARVLRPGGVFMEMTYGAPARRAAYLQLPHLPWSVVALAIRQLAPAEPKPAPVPAGAAALQDTQEQSALGAARGEHHVPSLGSLTLELPDTLGPFEADDVRMDNLNSTEVDVYYFVYVCTKHPANGKPAVGSDQD